MNLPPNRAQKLAIFDGHGIIHRAYYALKDNPLAVRRTGEQTSAVFGFTNTLLAVIDDLKPTHVAVAMDLPGPTFRHLQDATYKATRFEGMKAQVVRSLEIVEGLSDQARLDIAEAVLSASSRDEVKSGLLRAAEGAGAPVEAKAGLEKALEPVQAAWDIGHQIGRVLEMMDAFNIPVYSAAGYEADDVIGTLAEQAEAAGIETYLVTLDTDFVQLIRPGVSLYMMRPYQRDMVTYDVAKAKERYQFDPPLMRDFKALRGDHSDNIPGIPGVGDGTATKLLVQFGDIDAIYAHVAEVKPDKVRGLLLQFEDQVRHAKDMATIRTEVPDIMLDLDASLLGRYDRNRVLELLRELEFRSLVPRLPPVIEDLGRPKPARRRRDELPNNFQRGRTGRPDRAHPRAQGASPSTSRRRPPTPSTRTSSASRSRRRRERRTTSRLDTRWSSAAPRSCRCRRCWTSWRRSSPTRRSRRWPTTASSTWCYSKTGA